LDVCHTKGWGVLVDCVKFHVCIYSGSRNIPKKRPVSLNDITNIYRKKSTHSEKNKKSKKRTTKQSNLAIVSIAVTKEETIDKEVNQSKTKPIGKSVT
jgi:hypothetical protein